LRCSLGTANRLRLASMRSLYRVVRIFVERNLAPAASIVDDPKIASIYPPLFPASPISLLKRNRRRNVAVTLLRQDGG